VARSGPFEAVATELERLGMDRWTARGTLQLALMDAGIDAGRVTANQLAIIVERLLPRQLQSQTGLDVNHALARLREVLAGLPGAGDEIPA
jgi:hypothetical protein